jgi:hypothetical protein
VAAFDFAAFYAVLGSVPTVAGDSSRLLYDFLEIQASVNPFTLLALRAEAGKAALNKAINARQNAYYAKYGNALAIISAMNTYYSPSVGDSKPRRLVFLSEIANDQANALKQAYLSDQIGGVVKTTSSVLTSHIDSGGRAEEEVQSNEEDIAIPNFSGQISPPPPDGAPFVGWNVQGSVNLDLHEGTQDHFSRSVGSADETQKIVNTDYGYRIPYLECTAQNERAQISLIDEQFAQFMYGQNLPNLSQVFQNELNSIDGDIFRLQVAFLNTILMSPISGTVTGIYKSPGDSVRAGEPVVRVENNDVVLLVATLIYRGLISIGSIVTVETTLFDQSGPKTQVTGNVVAARGRREDDQWEVIVQCGNLASGKPIFPLGYHFDYDASATTVTIA